MELYEQIAFANRVGVYLKNFKVKKPRLWEFSHTCEKEGANGKTRARAYIYQPGNHQALNVRCHHCGYSASLSRFLEATNSTLYNEYRLGAYRKPTEVAPQALVEEPVVDASLEGLIPVRTLPNSSPVRKFLEARKIPTKHYKDLYVARHFYQWASRYQPEFRTATDNSPRLILPYFNRDKKVMGFAARTFSPKVEPRYILIRINKNSDFIYGIDRLDASKPVYVTEGQIDSLFIDNAIAVSGASYDKEFLQQIKDRAVLIPDQDWKRNAQVARQVKKAILDGFQISLLPDTVKGKDLNDMVKRGLGIDQLKDVIDSHTVSGLKAQLEFTLLKRCTI